MLKSDHSALPHSLSQQLGFRSAAFLPYFPSAGAVGAVPSLLLPTTLNTQVKSKVWSSAQEKMDENTPCYARNYIAKHISRCSDILWPLLVSNSCWAIFKSRDDSEVCLQGEMMLIDVEEHSKHFWSHTVTGNPKERNSAKGHQH